MNGRSVTEPGISWTPFCCIRAEVSRLLTTMRTVAPSSISRFTTSTPRNPVPPVTTYTDPYRTSVSLNSIRVQKNRTGTHFHLTSFAFPGLLSDQKRERNSRCNATSKKPLATTQARSSRASAGEQHSRTTGEPHTSCHGVKFCLSSFFASGAFLAVKTTVLIPIKMQWDARW